MKKAQVTIFVIVGLLVLILVGLLLFIQNSKKNPFKPNIQEHKELEPMREFVEECMQLKAKEGLIILGQQGGYIDTTRLSTNLIDPTIRSSEGIYFPPITDPEDMEDARIVPYWSRMKSSNNCQAECQFESQKKNIDFIAMDLADYVEEHLGECTQDFTIWTEKGYDIEPLDDEQVTVTFTEMNVLVEMEYPLRITRGQDEFRTESYSTEVELRFKKIYGIAERILKTIANEDVQYLERLSIEILSPFAMEEDSKLPPLASVTDSSNDAPNMWVLAESKELMGELFHDYISMVRVQGTKNNVIPLVLSQDAAIPQFYRKFPISIRQPGDSEEDLQMFDYSVDMNYYPMAGTDPYSNIYFRINGKQGVAMPDVFMVNFPIRMGLAKYDFSYDYSFPILVRIRDHEAFGGEGYILQYAYELNVRGSKPMTPEYETFEPLESGMNLFCELNQRNSGDIVIKSVLHTTEQPIDDVLITYDCLADACPIGSTKYSGGEALLKSKLPICMGGSVVPYKKGYFGHRTALDTKLDREAEVTVTVEEFKELNLEVKKVELSKTDEGWAVYGGTKESLDVDEFAMVILKRLSEDGEEEYQDAVTAWWNITDDGVVELVSGKYVIQAYVYKGIGPGYSLDTHTLFTTREAQSEYSTSDEDIFVLNSSIVIGSIDMNDEEAYTITPDDLEKGTITVYVPATNLANLELAADLGVPADGREYYADKIVALEPEFS